MKTLYSKRLVISLFDLALTYAAPALHEYRAIEGSLAWSMLHEVLEAA